MARRGLQRSVRAAGEATSITIRSTRVTDCHSAKITNQKGVRARARAKPYGRTRKNEIKKITRRHSVKLDTALTTVLNSQVYITIPGHFST